MIWLSDYQINRLMAITRLPDEWSSQITRAKYPQCLPITSKMNVLRWDESIGAMLSTVEIILCKAVSVPMVMSVPQKSLSMDPTIPTMFNMLLVITCSFVNSSLRLNFESSKRLNVVIKKVSQKGRISCKYLVCNSLIPKNSQLIN